MLNSFVLSLFVLMAPRVVEVKLGPVQREIVRAEERFTDVEGALRSAKTWSVLIRIRRQCEEYPGIKWAIARWTEGDLNQKLIPDYRAVCGLMGIGFGQWNARESCYDLPNASRIYCVHLKTSQRDNRYATVRGLTVAGFYIDQLEEVPQDVYQEAALRLSQPGYPQQMIVSPNPVPEQHWIAKHWPIDNRFPDRRYIRVSIWDNRHNLDPKTIAAAESLYPVGHPQRRTKLEGKRGLEVSGTPVYTGAFDKPRHANRALTLNDQLPLCESYDYGFHHPCVVFYQYAPWGWLRVLGGVMGSDLHLDAFLPIVERYRDLWFPKRLRLDATCDPAGMNENSQGLRGTPVGLLQDWYREHGERDQYGKFVVPVAKPDANQPERRYAATELAATYMRHQVNGDEAFRVDPERWILAELNDERFENFFVDGLEAGYVLEDAPRHSSRLGSYSVPKKDGFFEHGQNCFEYGMQAHVMDLPLEGARAAKATLQHSADVKRQELAALRKSQQDTEDSTPRVKRVGLRSPGRTFARGRRGRGGY